MVFHKVRMLFGLLHLPLDLPALLIQGCALAWHHQQVQQNGFVQGWGTNTPRAGTPTGSPCRALLHFPAVPSVKLPQHSLSALPAHPARF